MSVALSAAAVVVAARKVADSARASVKDIMRYGEKHSDYVVSRALIVALREALATLDATKPPQTDKNALAGTQDAGKGV